MTDPVQLAALAAAVIFAAALQSATGIGFAVVTSPMLLLITGEPAGVQTAAVLSLLIAVIAVRGALRGCDWKALRPLLLVGAVATPIGAGLFAVLDARGLKLAAAAATLVVLIAFRFRPRPGAAPRRSEVVGFGAVSGVFGGALGMPGPAAAAQLARAGLAPDAVRATVLTLFLFSYPAMLACHALMTGVDGGGLRDAALLAPAVAVGAAGGAWLAPRVPAAWWRRAVSVVLAGTVVGLAASALGARL